MKKSQSKRILQYLQSGKSLNPLQALSLFGCFRLGARIWDLKDAGYKVKSKIVKSDNKHFSQYSLEKL